MPTSSRHVSHSARRYAWERAKAAGAAYRAEAELELARRRHELQLLEAQLAQDLAGTPSSRSLTTLPSATSTLKPPPSVNSSLSSRIHLTAPASEVGLQRDPAGYSNGSASSPQQARLERNNSPPCLVNNDVDMDSTAPFHEQETEPDMVFSCSAEHPTCDPPEGPANLMCRSAEFVEKWLDTCCDALLKTSGANCVSRPPRDLINADVSPSFGQQSSGIDLTSPQHQNADTPLTPPPSTPTPTSADALLRTQTQGRRFRRLALTLPQLACLEQPAISANDGKPLLESRSLLPSEAQPVLCPGVGSPVEPRSPSLCETTPAALRTAELQLVRTRETLDLLDARRARFRQELSVHEDAPLLESRSPLREVRPVFCPQAGADTPLHESRSPFREPQQVPRDNAAAADPPRLVSHALTCVTPLPSCLQAESEAEPQSRALTCETQPLPGSDHDAEPPLLKSPITALPVTTLNARRACPVAMSAVVTVTDEHDDLTPDPCQGHAFQHRHFERFFESPSHMDDLTILAPHARDGYGDARGTGHRSQPMFYAVFHTTRPPDSRRNRCI